MQSQIETRVNELESSDLSYSEIFHLVCDEFCLDAESLVDTLGCPCPFGLIGYLGAEIDD